MQVGRVWSEVQKDDTLKLIMCHVQNSWQEKRTINKPLKTYFKEESNLSVNEAFLLRGIRLVIPPSYTKTSFKVSARQKAMLQTLFGGQVYPKTLTS